MSAFEECLNKFWGVLMMNFRTFLNIYVDSIAWAFKFSVARIDLLPSHCCDIIKWLDKKEQPKKKVAEISEPPKSQKSCI